MSSFVIKCRLCGFHVPYENVKMIAHLGEFHREEYQRVINEINASFGVKG